MKKDWRKRLKRNLAGYAFVSPFLIGLVLFMLGPILASFVLGFTRWNLFTPPDFIGLANFAKLSHDPLFFQSLKVTLYYTVLAVPLGLAFALLLALLVNQGLPGSYIFRTAFFMPNIVAGVALLLVWVWMLDPDAGLINRTLDAIGITRILNVYGLDRPQWLKSPQGAVPGLVLMSLTGVGGTMMILLAGLQNIPPALYEAAQIDGAGPMRRFRHITVPMLSPTLFFLTIVGIIMSFQIFNQAFVMTNGGPANATLFYSLYLYRNAFEMYRMGYACAMALVLFLIILAVTLVQIVLGRRWVHYQ